MTSLLTNSAAMTALTTLKSINQQLDTTSNRVSTGQRVSSASDNAAYWSIATAVRTDNSSLSAVKDSLGLGSSAVDTAYNGLNSILTDLQNLRAKLQTAMQPGVDRAKVQTEVAAIQNKMKATADSSVSSGQNWLSVDSSASNSAYNATQSVIAGFNRSSSGQISFSTISVSVGQIKLYDVNTSPTTTDATEAKVVGAQALNGTAGFSAGTMDFNTADGTGRTKQVNFTIAVAGASSASVNIVLDKTTLASAVSDMTKVTTNEFLNAINNQITASAANGKVTASLDAAGRLVFQSTEKSAAASVSVTDNVATNGKFALADIGYGTSSGFLAADTNYANIDLSSGSKGFSIGDGTATTTVTLTAATYTALGANHHSSANTAVDGYDVAAMINTQLAAANNKARATFDGTKISFGTTSGASTTVTIGHAADEDVLGFTSTTADATGTGKATGVQGQGTAAGTAAARGILDTIDNGTNFSINTINISALSGSSGDNRLSDIITQVDKAIAKVTDAGTKLGANKTQIDGQKTFVDTLIKANDRTVGTLVDADIEEESTKLKALQTQQQLAVQSLSIANSSSQNVLSLFR